MDFARCSTYCAAAARAPVGAVATAFGCPFEGVLPDAQIVDCVARYVDLGVAGVTFGDTTGMADPSRVEQLVGAVRKRWPDLPLTLHFHNTRGMGLANVLAGLAAGVVRFEGCLGGLGGCPFAPGATGNVCTEDVVHMLQCMGYDTGVDLDLLLAASRRLGEIVGSRFARAGRQGRQGHGSACTTRGTGNACRVDSAGGAV